MDVHRNLPEDEMIGMIAPRARVLGVEDRAPSRAPLLRRPKRAGGNTNAVHDRRGALEGALASPTDVAITPIGRAGPDEYVGPHRA